MKFLVLLSLIFLPLQIFAQESSFSEEAIIAITPEIPAPRDTVLATVRSSQYINLKKAEVVWSIDNKEIKRGIGESSFQFRAPDLGQVLNLKATIIRSPGDIFSNLITIKTAGLDLIHEANTYTPPFYKGRSLFTTQSNVTIAALADLRENNTRLSKNQIIYNWYRDGQYISSISGVGKDSAVFTGGILSKPFDISVLAESLNSDLKAKKIVYIKNTAPNVVLYENNPIYGNIFEKALTGTFNFDREEVGITAVPYFFSAEKRASGSLKYSWFENGKKIGDDTFGSFINYLNPERSANGVSNLRVRINNSENFLQSGENSFKINVQGIQQSDTIENTTNANSPF
jgi:hypothetical protein